MNELSDATVATTAENEKQPWPWVILLASLVLLIYVFRDGLALMVEWWDMEEYSHGYMIPMVALFLAWQRVNRLPNAITPGSWWGLALLVFGLFIFVAGELSALYTIIQYGFLLCLLAFALMSIGWGGTLLLWVSFVYLLFMIPLPAFLYNNLSSQLQLISSEIGVAVIRLFGISVYLEGNVIDLGSMKLQVVEACSGLRYLFPLMSFGFLIAYLYRGPFWQRALLFLSTMPITVLMNSFRIGVIGVTVDRWGQAAAEGFLHDFEGWVVFMGCVGVLFFEIWIFHLLSRDGRSMLDRIDLDLPKLTVKPADFHRDWHSQRPLLAGAVLLAMATPWLVGLSERDEFHPERQRFNQFPLLHHGWSGREGAIEEEVLGTLKLTDYIKADYVDSNRAAYPVNFYVAYYESQKKGSAIHSPRSCIPGGGWRIESLEQRELPVQHAAGAPLRVNRALIQKGEIAQLVYYWFDGRDRNITNEYLAKWYIFWDSLTRSRSDGALVRVVTFVPDVSEIDAADQQLTRFVQDFYPSLPEYVP